MDILTDFRDKGGEEESYKHQSEREMSSIICIPYAPQQGIEPAAQVMCPD